MIDEKPAAKQNYFLTLIKFFLFLIIFCFLVSLSKQFYREIKGIEDLNVDMLFLSILSAFSFYTFIADLNDFYKKMQNFFFHSSFASYMVPSFLILLGLGYYILPKVFSADIDKGIFIFLGGFISTSHLIFVARETKGNTFAAFINYLFTFSILYIVILFLLAAYLTAAFKIDLHKILVDGIMGGAALIKDLFGQVLH
jgi:signal transduction histidine kinase